MKSARLVPLLALGFLVPVWGSETPRTFQTVSEIVTGWTPEQHLWIRGSLGLSAAKLTELEEWLDRNAPNWTVVLMENAQGQRFDRHSGVRAVEFALGKGLPNQTGFGDLEDSRTEQSNGAIFALFLSERKFSYFASDAHDSRRLGEQYWVGRLDQPAVRAMRSGGRIVDAVKDTITSIESSLAASIREEENRRRLAEIARQEAIEEARGYPAQLAKEIAAVEQQVAALRASHPGLIGPVVHPDLPGWRATGETISRLAEQGDAAKAREHYSETLESIREFRAGLREWGKAPETFASLEHQIGNHPLPESAPTVDGYLSRARLALSSARENHETGEPLYADQLREAERELSNARAEYRNWTEAERLKRLIRNGIALLAAIVLLIFLVVSNRMRRPAKKEAEKLFSHWKKELRGKFDTLFSLMDRAGVVVGSQSDLKASGWMGRTREVGHRTIRTVDELFIMSAATDQVMQQVGVLLEPPSLPGRVRNRFSSRNYSEAIRLLESEPIGFDREDHLEAVLSPGASAGNRDRTVSRLLLGKPADYEPFRISFEKLIEEYDTHQAHAEADLVRLEAGIDGLPLSLQRLWEDWEECRELTDRLAREAGEDTFFPLVSLRRDLLVAIQSNLEALGEKGEKDPLDAYENELPESTRLATEARALTRAIESFRAIDLPVVVEKRNALQERTRQTGWVGAALRDLTARSENLARRALEEPVSDGLGDLRDDLVRFKGRVVSCLAMTDRVAEEMKPHLTETEELLTATRERLSRELSLPADSLLRETDLSPEEQLRRAERGIEAALSAIDHGEAETAQSTLADSEQCLDDARLMIAISERCVKEHRERIADLEKLRATLEEDLPEVIDLLEELKSRYAPSVLLFSSRFGAEVDGQQSIANCIERANRRLEQAQRDMTESRESFDSGALIRAAGLLEAIANELGFARHQLELVRDQRGALGAAEKANEAADEWMTERLRELEIMGGDRRTGPESVEALLDSAQRLAAFSRDRNEDAPDPFQLAHEAEKLRALLRSIEDGIKSDWEAHEVADSAATGARAALTICHSHLREAHRDGIPDSRALTRAIQRHEELTTELARLDRLLEVPHEDWGQLFESINAIHAETAKVRATLEEELKAARDAATQLQSAAGSLKSLQKWRSAHSVSINRRAGMSHLLEAKQALAVGNYASARTSSVRATGEALREIRRAKSREAQAAAEAAAAHRASLFSAASSSSFSSGGFSGGSSFSSSSSSGFSSSGFSSGSGFSSSGW